MSDLIKRAWLEDGKFVWHEWQDAEDIIENNHALRSQEQHSDFLRHQASIPLAVYHQWFYDEVAKGNTTLMPFGEEMDAIVQRNLNDIDWYKLRTDK